MKVYWRHIGTILKEYGYYIAIFLIYITIYQYQTYINWYISRICYHDIRPTTKMTTHACASRVELFITLHPIWVRQQSRGAMRSSTKSWWIIQKNDPPDPDNYFKGRSTWLYTVKNCIVFVGQTHFHSFATNVVVLERKNGEWRFASFFSC